MGYCGGDILVYTGSGDIYGNDWIGTIPWSNSTSYKIESVCRTSDDEILIYFYDCIYGCMSDYADLNFTKIDEYRNIKIDLLFESKF